MSRTPERDRRWLRRSAPVTFASLAFVTSLAASRPAQAQTRFVERLAVRGEGGLTLMLPSYQRDVLQYNLGVQGTGRFAVSVVPWLAVQLSFGSWYTPSGLGAGQQYPLTLGARFEPRLGTVGRLFVDANAGASFMPDRTRFGLDVGVGFEFGIGRHIGLGPVVRYALIVASSDDYPSHAQLLSFGASLSVRFGPERDPERDDDTDGVRNRDDECPDDAPGLNPDRSRPGCPLPDRDHDNVPDSRDACPDLAGSPSTDPARNGCSGMVRLEENELRIAENIQFRPNSDEIDPHSDGEIRELADAMRANPQIRRVSVDGHTDDLGEHDLNMQLSQRRAESVRQRLIQLGVEPGRLEAHGYGETRPLVPGTSPRARAANRRVEFRIVDPAPPRR